MANADTPSGFVPYRHHGGGVIRQNSYKIEAAYATSIYRGDAVLLTSGFVVIGAHDSSSLLGVFMGCKYRNAAGETIFSPYWPASTATLNSEAVEAFVIDDPNVTYKVQTDTGTAYVDATHKGSVYDLELDHAGSTFTGQSGMELDLADTSEGHFRILRLIDEPDNAAGLNANVEVINSLVQLV